jgi:hypothetical protein
MASKKTGIIAQPLVQSFNIRPTVCLRNLARAPRATRYASTGNNEDRQSFKGQLYESTSKRLERERAEQRRYASARGEDQAGRASAILFSTWKV